MDQLQDENYVADAVPTTSQSDSNKEIDGGPLPASSEVINALALVRRYCVNMEDCGLSCSDSLDNVEACVRSQAANSLKQKKIQDYFVPKWGTQLRKPHAFLTLSAAEVLWDRLVEKLERLRVGDKAVVRALDELNSLQRVELCNNDPVACAIYSHRVLDVILNILKRQALPSVAALRGDIEFFKRVEF
ncbi:hypothetical protein HPB50_013807 [Hyalomma asiaticum]|uniref:Uncharacterized protein n=1 Tax=Hyalomma asiaticum TaxID=266040 RepID=A0ACB7SE71_HYAAI|nr:hypothetical protein HPB50_013807 [Hyalomma asiaticum]